MRRLLCALLLLSALPALPADSRIQKIESGLAGRMLRHVTPGLSIAVVENGRIAWARGYGVLAQTKRKPAAVTSRTLFQMASISKPVAAIAAMRLVERGALPIDQDVNATLSSWKLPSNHFTAAQPVTLRHLLTHTAGIRSGPIPGYTASEPLPTLLDVLRGSPFVNTPQVRVDFLPGSRSSYSNGAFLVVQQLLSDASHKPFPDLMRELVLKPAGMKRSAYEQPLPEKWRKQAASGHRDNGRPIPGGWHAFPEQAAIGLWSTPTDLSRLAIELSRAFQGQSPRLLSQQMAQEMFRPHAGAYGLAWVLDGEGDSLSVRHSGSNEGYRSLLIFYPRLGKGAAIAANSDLGADLIEEVIHLIAQAYLWPNLTHPLPARLSALL